ncbi:hypothetical protein [Streptomyces mashuensis]|nr:hypothetical protein [Streptomyces mashuensis]
MKRTLLAGVAGTATAAALLGLAAPAAHADGKVGDALKPVVTSTGSAACRPDYGSLPVVSQYAGVVAEACRAGGLAESRA